MKRPFKWSDRLHAAANNHPVLSRQRDLNNMTFYIFTTIHCQAKEGPLLDGERKGKEPIPNLRHFFVRPLCLRHWWHGCTRPHRLKTGDVFKRTWVIVSTGLTCSVSCVSLFSFTSFFVPDVAVEWKVICIGLS